MRKVSLSVGVMLFLGFLLIVCALVLTMKGFNPLDGYVHSSISYLVLANTCFVLAFIFHIFDRPTE